MFCPSVSPSGGHSILPPSDAFVLETDPIAGEGPDRPGLPPFSLFSSDPLVERMAAEKASLELQARHGLPSGPRITSLRLPADLDGMESDPLPCSFKGGPSACSVLDRGGKGSSKPCGRGIRFGSQSSSSESLACNLCQSSRYISQQSFTLAHNGTHKVLFPNVDLPSIFTHAQLLLFRHALHL